MATKVPDKLTGRERYMFVRKCLCAPRQHFFYNNGKNVDHVVDGFDIGGMFLTSKEARADASRLIPGKQNKHHGRQPGSYKRKRLIVKNSRRRNRSK